MPDRLAGKVALVTGGRQGIGKAIALRLAEEGADVIIDYFGHPADAQAVADAAIALGRRAAAISANVASVPEVRDLIRQGVERLGKIDILFNNAGVEKRANFWEATEADYDFVLNINLKGAFFTTQAFVNHLLERKAPGKIINISSVHEELPFPHFTSYCASKGGVKMMTRNLAIELAPFGITINSIAPGAIETPINTALMHDPAKLKDLLSNIPLGRLGSTGDVSGVAAFLSSADADYITGTTVFVDGGLLWNYQEQ